MLRCRSLILTLAMLPALAGCTRHAPAQATHDDPQTVVATKPVAPRAALVEAIDALFADGDAGETRALVIMANGGVVAEGYGAGYTKDSRLIGWSMSKTVTGVMIGMLISDGRLALDQNAPVTAWQRPGDPRGAITIRQLLQMRSGLRHAEASDPVYESSEVRMLFLDGRDDMARWAEEQPLEAQPGEQWKYSSATSVILSDITAHALTDSADPDIRRKAVADYLRTRIFDPIGMTSMVPEFDAAGTLVGSSLIHGTARDWARFGEFLRNSGSVRGAQLLPRGWVEFMTTPNPRNPGYGAQLWLNRKQSDGSIMLMPGKAPASTFACIGHLGQYVVVSPTQKLTVVRLGKSTAKQRERVLEHLATIMALFPRQPG